jgi:hypothetical protein
LSAFQRTSGGSCAICSPRGAIGSGFIRAALIAGSLVPYIHAHITKVQSTSVTRGKSIARSTMVHR